jgi:2-(1,2-epoxy-1,2-dihydrophenyl)acetyl-CoA isomerase
MYQTIIYESKGKAAFVSLNRPEVYNALNAKLLEELRLAVTSASKDPNIRVIILSGGSCKAFSSGADLKSGLAAEPLGKVLERTYNPLITAMINTPKPIICKLNGLAAGAGMSLALACDMILAHEDAYLTELFVGIGLMPDAGSMYFLPRLIGTQKTFELCATGRKVFMPEAKTLGLILDHFDDENLEKAIDDYINIFSEAATKSIGQMKKTLHMSVNSSFSEVLALEAEGQTICGFSSDFMEGVHSFITKKKPEFKGK